MLKWLSPPQLEDEYQTFAASVLHYTLLLFIVIVIILFPFALPSLRLTFLPAVVVLFALCLRLLHTKHIALAGGIFLSGLWLVLTIAAMNINGIYNSVLSSYVLVIIYAAVLLSNRMTLVFIGLIIGSTIFVAVLQMMDILPLQTIPFQFADRIAVHMGIFGGAGILLATTSRVIRRNIARIQAHERILLDRNRELEHEIAERHRTESNLRASEQKYRMLFENTTMMACVYDRNGIIVLMNNAAAAVFGKTPEALQGKSFFDLLSPEDAKIAHSRANRVIDTGVPEIVEGGITLPDGRYIYYMRQVMPLPKSFTTADSNGEPASQVLALTTDLTEQKRAEEQERELALAREKNAFLTDFLSTVSHDLKTPLTVMHTSLHLLENSQDEARKQVKIEQLKNQVVLLDKYIQDMLTISQLEYLPSLNIEELTLHLLVEETLQQLRPRAEEKRIDFTVEAPSDLPIVPGDRAQLHRMLINLIENAINYTPDNGRVLVNLESLPDYVALVVQDTGMGIAPTDISHIFERFYRATQARNSDVRGTGLGLAIVKKIVDIHKGEITVDSQPECGTTFTVHLPTQQATVPSVGN